MLVVRIWDDYAVNMLWLDSKFPVDGDETKPGVLRGTCATTSGSPPEVEVSAANATVTYSRFNSLDLDFILIISVRQHSLRRDWLDVQWQYHHHHVGFVKRYQHLHDLHDLHFYFHLQWRLHRAQVGTVCLHPSVPLLDLC